MKPKTEKELARQNNLFGLMEKNLKKWENLTKLKESYDHFVRNLKKINDDREILNKDLTELKNELEIQRNRIIEKLIPVANLMELYAEDHKKKSLRKMTSMIRDGIKSMPDAKLHETVVSITGLAEKKLVKEESREKDGNILQEYGLSLSLVEELKGDNERFFELTETLKARKKDLKEAEKDLQKRISENKKLIKKRFDRFMTIFRIDDRNFYQEYQKSLKNGMSVVKNEEPGKSDAESQNKGEVLVQKQEQVQGLAKKTKAAPVTRKRKSPGSTVKKTAQKRENNTKAPEETQNP